MSETSLLAVPDADASPKGGSSSRLLLAGLGVLMVAALGAWKLFPGRSVHPPEVETVVPVESVHRGDLSRTLILEAEFRPYQDLDLHARVAGFVREIPVDVGDRVREGDRLAVLEIPQLPEDIARAEAVERRSRDESRRAELAYEQAHLQYERLSATAKAQPRLVAQQDLDDSLSRERSAQVAWDATKESVQIAGAEARKLRRQEEDCRIVAPFSGVISRRYADPGDLVRGGTSPSTGAMPLLHLSQNDRLRLVFPVPASQVPKVNLGDPVEIRVESPPRKIPGQIARFSREIQANTRTMEVEVDVTNTDLSLVPGMYASVALVQDRRPNTLSVPLEAVSRQDPPSVLVVGADGRIERRVVALGLETPERIEVLTGLKENETVVLGGRGRLQAGQKVRPQKRETSGKP